MTQAAKPPHRVGEENPFPYLDYGYLLNGAIKGQHPYVIGEACFLTHTFETAGFSRLER